MSDRKAKKLAEMRAMSDAAFAANPGAVNSLPAMDAEPAEIAAMVADGQAEQELIQRIAKNGVEARRPSPRCAPPARPT
jgi:acetylglutamate kinase